MSNMGSMTDRSILIKTLLYLYNLNISKYNI